MAIARECSEILFEDKRLRDAAAGDPDVTVLNLPVVKPEVIVPVVELFLKP